MKSAGRPGSQESEKRPSGELRLLGLLGGALVLVTAVLLASVMTPAPHTGGDNAGYLSLAHALARGLGYTEQWDPAVGPHTKYPPVFALSLSALVLAGASTWTAFKLVVAGWLSLAVLLVFVWVTERRGPIAGVAVALLTLVSSGWLEASRWILSEPLFLALTFLALWAAERGLSGRDFGERAAAGPWLALAGGAAILAFFTRSAGLPLVIAFGAALLLERRLRALGVFVAALAPLALWWTLRARLGGEGAYQSEFWMVNPYEPELGTIGVLDLPGRVWRNLVLYVGEVLPGEWWATGGAAGLVTLGLVLVGLTGVGWWLQVRKSPGVAETFAPLYLGLILLWPEVWSGDRFLLPLHPLVLLYSGAAVARAAQPLGRTATHAVLAAGFLALALPAVPGWMTKAQGAAACRRVAASGDVFGCHGPGFQEFRNAAAWSGANLPPDAVVLNRKPRIHYLLGGPRGRTFPFTRSPDLLLEEADRIGARYLLLDRVDGIAPYYLPAVIQARPLAFCHITGWGGEPGAGGTDLFGILPPDSRRAGTDISRLGPCPRSYLAAEGAEVNPEGRRIPRFVDRPADPSR